MEFQQTEVLHVIMASLDIDDPPKEDRKLRRSLRRRSGLFEHIRNINILSENECKTSEPEPPVIVINDEPKENVTENVSKPKKRKASKKDETEAIKEYFLCKKVKRLPPSNETIYEEPKVQKNGTVVHVATRKQRRVLPFTESINKDKIKKRRLKIKQNLKGKSIVNRKRIPMDTVMEKLNVIESPVASCSTL